MSAIHHQTAATSYIVSQGHIEPRSLVNLSETGRTRYPTAHKHGGIFYFAQPEPLGRFAVTQSKLPVEKSDSIAFDGQIPEIAIASLIGANPDRLVDGFTAAEKPAGCGWMAYARIKSIVNHIGCVLVELEPAA